MNRLRRFPQRGAVAVEFALVLPLLLLLVLGGIDWGYYFFAGEIAANAAREGARAAALIRDPATDPCSVTVGGPKISTNYMQAGGLISGSSDGRLRPFDCTVETCAGQSVASSCCQVTTVPGFSDPVVRVTVSYQARPCSMSLTGYLGTLFLPKRVVASATMKREPP